MGPRFVKRVPESFFEMARALDIRVGLDIIELSRNEVVVSPSGFAAFFLRSFN